MSGYDPTLEARILERLDAADPSGAATLALRGYGPQILGYLTAVLRDDDRSSDAFSIFSENLWTGLSTFKRESSLRTWAYKIAWNAAMRVARDPQRRRGAPLPTSQALAIAQEVRSRTAEHLRTEKKTALEQLREELTADEQTLLILRVDRDLEWREVSAVLEVEEPVLWKRFERLKTKLKKLAKERGITNK
jgi:RNA polymerase sigma-70 factor (ECF subfamily)